MATFSLSTFKFKPKSDFVTNTEVGSVLARAISNAKIVDTLGGDDSIFGIATAREKVFGIENFESGVISMGAGKDIIAGIAIASRAMADSSASDYYTSIIGIRNKGKIDLGAGNDIIFGVANGIAGSNYSYSIGIDNSGSINTGNGNDRIIGNANNIGIDNGGRINMGTGNDSISGVASTAQLFVSSTAKNSIGIYNYNQINMGAGNDSISGAGDIGISNAIGGKIDMGAGNDSISATNTISSNSTGINNYISTIDMGAGDDSISSTTTASSSGGASSTSINNTKGIINMGTGNDSIFGNAKTSTPTGFGDANGITNTSGTIDMGLGNDIIKGIARSSNFANGISNTSGKIDMGLGNDRIIGIASGSEAYGIDNAMGLITMGDGNDSISGTIDSRYSITHNSYGLYNSGTVDAGIGNDNLFFAVNLAGVSQKVTINGAGKIFMGLDNDSFTGFGDMTIYGDAGTGNTSKQDVLDLSLFKSSDFIIKKVGAGENYVEFTYNDVNNLSSPSVVMTTNEFDKFIFADKTVNYSLLA